MTSMSISSSAISFAGFGRLFKKELQSWWGTRRWLVQGLIWTLGLNGLLFVALFILPGVMAAQGESLGDPLEVGGQMFFALGMMATAVGVVVLSQGEVIDERQSGTAAWILAKPVSRSAFLLAKLLAHGLSMLVLMVLVPAALAFLQMTIASSGGVGLTGFVTAVAITALHSFFYLSLTILLGVIMNNRGAILGVSLAVLLGGMLLRSLPVVGLIMPWVLPDVAGAVVVDPSKLFAMPVMMTALWTALFVLGSFVAFERVEL